MARSWPSAAACAATPSTTASRSSASVPTGGLWYRVEGLAPVAWPSGIAAPRDGGVWVAALNPGWGFVGLAFEDGILLRYDGETWLPMQPHADAATLGVAGLAVGPDGALWALLRVPMEQDRTDPHLARLQDQSGRRMHPGTI